MSFGRRLALFVLLLVIVPMMALVSILLFISDDARGGKADARLAAGMETALALYEEEVADGTAAARRLASRPGLGAVIAARRRDELVSAADRALAGEAVAVQILDANRGELLLLGSRDAVAFGQVSLRDGARVLGTVRVSTIIAGRYAAQVKRLTERELVLSRGDAPLASTVTPPEMLPPNGETTDIELEEGEYRARRQLLDDGSDESILLLGPRKEGGALAIGRPAGILLAGFLALAGVLAFILARELTGLHDRVAAEAITDPLTGLWNRRRLDHMLAREEELLNRYGRQFSLVIADVDGFKSVNDRHGHPQGDRVLRRIAQIIERETRNIDESVRYGGDEFAMLLPETDDAGAQIFAERLRDAVYLSALELRSGERLRMTVSVGVATAPDDADTAGPLVDAADDALLRAKREGKNRVVRASQPSRD